MKVFIRSLRQVHRYYGYGSDRESQKASELVCRLEEENTEARSGLEASTQPLFAVGHP